MHDLAAWNHLDLQSPLDYGWTLQIPPAGWHSPLAATQAYSPTSPDATTSSDTATSSGSTTYSGGSASLSGAWQCIAQAESGANPATNTGNGYYGEFQFTQTTWNTLMQQMGLSYSRADLAPASVQYSAAQHLQEESGWGQWPASSSACGLG